VSAVGNDQPIEGDVASICVFSILHSLYILYVVVCPRAGALLDGRRTVVMLSVPPYCTVVNTSCVR
jgi:hypothetical protein